MAQLSVYRTYRYIDKDPVIDKVRTLVQDEGLFKKLSIVHQLSGVSTSTLENWFHGDTRSPQNRTVCAVITALGYEHSFVKSRQIEIEKELQIAARWLARQNDKAKPKRAAKTRAVKTRSNFNGHHRAGANR